MAYRYYSINRPVGPGTYPNNGKVDDIKNFDTRKHVDMIGRDAWGYIDYSERFSLKEIQQNELVYGGEAYALDDKQHICNLLLETLQATRGASDLVSLEFDPVKEIVTGTFEGGGIRRCNVACDSGVSLIRDVINQLKL